MNGPHASVRGPIRPLAERGEGWRGCRKLETVIDDHKSSNAVIHLHTVPYSTARRVLSVQASLSAENGVSLTHMRCMTTANLRASATRAFRIPRRRATLSAQSLSQF